MQRRRDGSALGFDDDNDDKDDDVDRKADVTYDIAATPTTMFNYAVLLSSIFIHLQQCPHRE